MLVVIDTNVLVSALWSKNGAPAQVIGMVLSGSIIPCFDYRIMNEYREVLQRPKFRFPQGQINALLDWFNFCGQSVIAKPIDLPFSDTADKKFYEVAKTCGAALITGNLKHFPDDPQVISVSEFLEAQQNHS